MAHISNDIDGNMANKNMALGFIILREITNNHRLHQLIIQILEQKKIRLITEERKDMKTEMEK